MKQVLAQNYVRPDEAEKVKAKIREAGNFKIIDKVSVTLNDKKDVYQALFHNLGVKDAEIHDRYVREFEKLLAGGIWCIVTLAYVFDEGSKTSPFVVTELKPIQMPNMDMDELMTVGERVYNTTCAACHMPNGEGLPGVFPALKGSDIALNDMQKHIDVVVNGVSGTAMQAYAKQLSMKELAAVITYERNAWGNDTGELVQAKDVNAVLNGQ